MTTVRGHLEAIHGHRRLQGAPLEVAADALMQCTKLAEAALAILDEAEQYTDLYAKPRPMPGGNHRLVADPDSSS